MNRDRLFLIAGLSFLSACATPHAQIQTAQFDLTHVHRIAVLPFNGTGGSQVTEEFVRQLLPLGIEISQSNQHVDAVLSGTVADYRENNKVLAFIGHAKVPVHDAIVDLSNPVVSAGSSNETLQALALGAQSPQIVCLFSSASVFAQLADPKTGRPVWSNEQSYEALDIKQAMASSVGMVVHALRSALNRPAAS